MRAIVFIAALIAAAVVTGCGAQTGDPEQVLKAFYKAANQGKYEEAKQYLSQEGIRKIEGPLGVLLGGWKRIMDKYTRGGTLEKVEVYDLNIRGEGATSMIQKHFKDNSTQVLPVEFIKENGNWKISWSTPTL